jgi:hypothetical protein
MNPQISVGITLSIVGLNGIASSYSQISLGLVAQCDGLFFNKQIFTFFVSRSAA